MNISINENIKRLRRERNITQEKLADYLKVSIQAVSKWERNETLPDITMIVPIASYFNISTDELLGVDAVKNEAKIQEYLYENNILLAKGKWNESVELMEKAHADFPNDYRITNWYMQLIIGGNADNKTDVVLSHAEELTTLCERILEDCTIDDIRHNAVDILAKINKAQGNIDKAFELLNRLPDWYTSRYQKSEQLFEKKTEEWNHWINHNFFVLFDFAINKLEKIIWFSEKPFEEKLKEQLRIIDYLLKILDETNYELLHHIIFTAYNEIGCRYRVENKLDEAIEYFDLALSYAKKFDDFIVSDRQVLQTDNKLKHDIAMYWGNTENRKWNSVKRQLAWYENNPWFEELRKIAGFSEMLEKYRPFAKDIN